MTLKALIAVLMVMMSSASGADGGVLVFGGTGRLGAPIVELLVGDGHEVTVFARPSSNRGRLDGLDVYFAVGDLMEAESVAAVLIDGAHRVVIDATSRGNSRESFYDVAMRNMVDAAKGRGVQQFILHGSAGAGDNAGQFPNAEWGRMRDVMAAKGRAEQILIDSRIPYTIIRNGLIQRDGTPATRRSRLTEDQSVFGVVTRADLALLTLQCVDNEDCLNRILHAVDDGFPIPDPFRN